MELVCIGKTLTGSKEETGKIRSLCKTLFLDLDLSLDGDDEAITRSNDNLSKTFMKILSKPPGDSEKT